MTDFEYDVSGNVTKMTDPLGKISTYAYDTLGRLTQLTDPKGQVFQYAYDGVDHLTAITNPDLTTVTYTRNCCNLTQATDASGTLHFTYDSLGRLTGFTNQDNKAIGYEYDAEGNLITMTYPDSKIVHYEYDADNRLIKVTDWLGNITHYAYDSRGNLSLGVSPGLITVYQYDTAGRLTKLINYNSNTAAVTSGFEFTMDANSDRTTIKRYLPLAGPVFSTVSSSYSYNPDNQLISATGKSFSYDNNGNMASITGSPSVGFTYNFNDQLTHYTSGTSNLSFQYDVLGNRIKKTAVTTAGYIVNPAMGLPSVLAETDSAGTITSYYVYGLGLISKIEGNNAYFYQYDGIGSTVAITDSTGAIKNKYSYDDFGNVATNSAETIANPFKYVGQFGVMTDADDLLYMRARYYVPSVGRFINKDPVGLAGGLNLYGYVGANAINLIDPIGLSPSVLNGGFCRLGDKDVWTQDDSIEPFPILKDPFFWAFLGIRTARWRTDPSHHGLGPHDHIWGRIIGPKVPFWGQRGARWRGWLDWLKNKGGWRWH
jgi:RHS repeat-associated protein